MGYCNLMRALLIEDNSILADALSKWLKEYEIFCDVVNNAESAMDMVKRLEFDVLLVDLGLSGQMSGNQFIQRIRNSLSHISHKANLPIIVMTGIGDFKEKMKSFFYGADDYMIKPVDRYELVARIHSVVRRSRGFAQNIIKVGEMSVNLSERKVYVNENPLKLTSKEYNLAELLFLRRGSSIDKSVILNHLYGKNRIIGKKITDVLMCKIRKKIKQYTPKEYLKTYWGLGYAIDNEDNVNQQQVDLADRASKLKLSLDNEKTNFNNNRESSNQTAIGG